MKVLVLGEILWDVFDDGERLGGAPFNFAAQLARLGHDPILVSGVGDDDRGREAFDRGRKLGVNMRWVRTTSAAKTGVVLVDLDDGGQPQYEIRRPAAYDLAVLSGADLESLADAPPDWIYYGSLFPHQPQPFDLLQRVLKALPKVPRFYDVNLRPDSYSSELLASLLPEATVLKVNSEEVRVLEGMAGDAHEGLEAFARRFAERHEMRGVCVTRGADGSSLLWDGEWAEAPGVHVAVQDTVGAGDAFSAALLHATSRAWPLARRAEFANRVGALIASQSGATPDWTPEEAWAL